MTRKEALGQVGVWNGLHETKSKIDTPTEQQRLYS